MSGTAQELFIEDTNTRGDTLVLVHGLGGSTNTWHPQTQALKADFRVVSYDLAGSGRSPLRDNISIQSQVKDMLGGIAKSGATRVHLGGHSMGTIVCQHLAVTAPEKVASMVLVGALPEPPEAARPALRDRASKARNEGMRNVADAVANAGTSSDSKVNHPHAIAFVRESLMAQNPEGYARNCEALSNAIAADLGKIQCPVLLITGDEDKTGPVPVAKAMQSGIGDSQLEIVPGCGHWATIERPKQVSYLMSLFGARNRKKPA